MVLSSTSYCFTLEEQMKRGQTNQTKDGPGFLIFILDKQENSQVGLVPSNYLQELSQFLTQDVNSGRNGSEGPVRTFSFLCLQTGKSFNSFLIPVARQQTDERQTGMELRTRRYRASPGTTDRSAAASATP